MNKSTIFILSTTIIALSCNHKVEQRRLPVEGVAKIVKVKTFSTKTEFDSLKLDKPAYNLGFDETIGMDFKWSTKYFDKSGNLLCQEDFHLNEKNEEEVDLKTLYEYSDRYKSKIKTIKKSSWRIVDSTREEYIRDTTGRLNEIRSIEGGKLIEKTKFTYNSKGQKVKQELFAENGLVEKDEWTYPTAHSMKPSTKSHEKFGEHGYKDEFNYEWMGDKQLVKVRKRYFENGVLLSDFTQSYYKYVGDEPTKIMFEGYDAPTRNGDGTIVRGEPYKKTFFFLLNDNGDLTEYKSEVEHDNNILGFDLQPLVYKLRYRYNPQKDWTQIIADFGEQYIVIREITYF